MNRIIEYMLPPQRSTVAAEVDSLFSFINIAGFILFAGIMITIIIFVIKYRRKSEDDVTPVITHNSILEVTWTVIPIFLILIVFSWGFRGFLTLSSPPANAYEINVTAASWLWEFEYPTGGTTVNEVFVPVDRPVKFIMRSDDVLHSLYVPDFRIKMDVLPNRYTTTWFQATETGESVLYCSEYCGTGHSDMLATVHVLTQEDFEEWLETGLEVDEDMPLAELGEATYTNAGCNACHSLDGTDRVGPSLAGLFGTERELEDGSVVEADEDYIRRSIVEPQAEVTAGYPANMPSYQGRLSDRQIDGLIAFIKELKDE
ncbi:cytochrome c oxidase subunit II [Natronogracilivirga saccharolytica]|uniref:Cytochrome c oxidase subunit 2 n=1 Tax=Natronogracilivirga saccharolytica TaxID=2812953 RepID=A0A8J7RK11_9BACT|nr:cytochrome c oxidase subunit II [Natronogracilivirga saccharolytica]MBP3191074.1 cytochrome c oxidase subunit II [Natronogracilivirga saccharolytica]